MAGIRVKIDTSEVEQAAKSLHLASKKARPLVEAAMKGYAYNILRSVRQEAPVKKGDLRKSLRVEGQGMDWSLISDSPYIQYVIGGRQGRTPGVFPRYKKALWWKDLPHPIAYTKSLGAVLPNDFVSRGLANAKVPIIKPPAMPTGRTFASKMGSTTLGLASTIMAAASFFAMLTGFAATVFEQAMGRERK